MARDGVGFSLFWRTFFLLALLLVGSIIAWLQTFDPTAFLIRKNSIAESEAPIGIAATDWTDCLRAATNLLSQCEQITPEGRYIANHNYDQLQMLIRCMPILLLRVRKNTPHDKKIATVRKNCARFLRGEWRGLTETALEELDAANKAANNRSPGQQPTTAFDTLRKQADALEEARKLN